MSCQTWTVWRQKKLEEPRSQISSDSDESSSLSPGDTDRPRNALGWKCAISPARWASRATGSNSASATGQQSVSKATGTSAADGAADVIGRSRRSAPTSSGVGGGESGRSKAGGPPQRDRTSANVCCRQTCVQWTPSETCGFSKRTPRGGGDQPRSLGPNPSAAKRSPLCC